jgi:hypothetical protein
MRKIGFLFFLLFAIAAYPQQEPDLTPYKTTEQKLKVWLKYADTALDSENYPKLL